MGGGFIRKYKSTVINTLIVLLVLGAVYKTTQENGMGALYHTGDVYIIAGAVLALVVLRMIRRRQENNKK